MKNKRMLSLLLAAAMIIALVPATAFAMGMENSEITNIEYYENGWLKKVTISYTVGSGAGAAAPTKMGIQTTKFENSELTNAGSYWANHKYKDWSDIPSTGPEGCGFVVWDTTGVFTRPGYSSTNNKHTHTIEFAEQQNFDKNATYYVYAWTDYESAEKVYPDGYICSFKVNSSGELVSSELYVTFDANGGTGSMAAQKFATGTAQALTANAFTREDYTFTGWNTKADGSGTDYTDGQTVTTTESLRLYAQWEATTPTVPNNPTPTAPAGKDNWVKYEGGNSFSSSKSAVPTSVEIDGQEVSFVGNGKNFTVGCVPAGAQRITVRWNSTSITTNFKPDAAAYCAEVEIPKTGDASVLAYALMAMAAAAGAMKRR